MTTVDFFAIGAAVFAILMAGSGQIRLNLNLYTMQTVCVAAAAIAHAFQCKHGDPYTAALALLSVKACAVPWFLSWIANKIGARSDSGAVLPISTSMHVSIVLLGLGVVLSRSVPHSSDNTIGSISAAISLLFTAMLFMLTRRMAFSQIIGFLTMENGIFLFAVTQTRGMPLIVEMGILLDVLVAVMIAGLFIFRISKSFEHIDVTRLDGLKER